MSIRSALIASCFAALLLGSAAFAGDPTTDPCTLLTRAEVEQALGKLKAAPKFVQFDRVRTCEYEFVDDTHELTLWLFPVVFIERVRQQYRDLVPVRSLGEEAFIHHDLDLDNTDLIIRKGNASLKVSIAETEGDEARVQAIGRKAIARLPAG